jgi:hypothetical protein
VRRRRGRRRDSSDDEQATGRWSTIQAIDRSRLERAPNPMLKSLRTNPRRLEGLVTYDP